MKKNFDAYRDALVEGGHDPADFDVPFMQQVWVGDSEAGLRQAAEAALNYYKSMGKVLPGSDEAIEAEVELLREGASAHRPAHARADPDARRQLRSVDHVVDTLGRLVSELGVNHYIGWFRIPSLERPAALAAMETFALEVIPQLKDLEPDPRSRQWGDGPVGPMAPKRPSVG